MAQRSAGLLMYRLKNNRPEVLLVHPGGPFWENKDEGAWSIPKGLCEPEEDALAAAKREFEEELGFPPEIADPVDLGEIRQKSGKWVKAWAFEGDCDPTLISSNTFSMQWPPNSGKIKEFPEIDRADWFDFQTARGKINTRQVEFINILEEFLVGS